MKAKPKPAARCAHNRTVLASALEVLEYNTIRRRFTKHFALSKTDRAKLVALQVCADCGSHRIKLAYRQEPGRWRKPRRTP